MADEVERCTACGVNPRAVRSKDPLRYRPRCRDCLLEQRRARPAERKARYRKNARTVDEERVPWMSPDPIRGWLTQRTAGVTDQEIALRCRLDDTGMGRLLRGRTTRVSLDTVDKILVAFGAPMELGRLYPHLYEDPSVFA